MRRRPRSGCAPTPYRRTLRLEPLEDRRLLANVTVTTLADTVDFNDGVTSLREAIFATNTVPGADTIDFAPALFANGPRTILLTQGELRITDHLTINGPGAHLLTIDASGNDPTPHENKGDGSRVFGINDGSNASVRDVTLVGMTLTGGDVAGEGGAISTTENLTVIESVIRDNSGGRGGGISGLWLTMVRSSVRDNSSSGDGGGIRARTLTVVESVIAGNICSFGKGGGICVLGSTLSVIDSVVESNSARGEGRGGGIWFAGANASISGSTIRNNSAGLLSFYVSSGGGIHLSGELGLAQVTIANSTIEDNTAAVGGGIFNGIDLVVTNSVITGNAATGPFPINPRRTGFEGGGGLYSLRSLMVSDSLISGNRSAGAGGGISASGSGTSIAGSTIIDNLAATHGGGLLLRQTSASSPPISVTASTIGGNSAGLDGGGVWGDFVTIVDSTIDTNSAESGGGLHLRNSTVVQSTVSGNTAVIGGGVYVDLNSDVARSTVALNAASSAGGGIFVGGTNLSLDHTIVAQNVDANQDVNGLIGSTITAQYSLIGMSGGSGLAPAPVGLPDANGNLIGGTTLDTSISAVEPVLADNGGPTMTHALLPGSPAINAGDLSAAAGQNDMPLFDQRGEPFGRIVGGRIDIGAFEFQTPTELNLLVDTLVDESDGNYSRGELSLREAIELANARPGHDTIRFDPALFANGTATILLTTRILTGLGAGSALWISDSLTIEGPGAHLLTIDASGNDPTPHENKGDGSRVFRINDASGTSLRDVTLVGMTLTGGDVAGEGGAIASSEHLTLIDSVVHGNSAADGGGVASSGLTIVRSAIRDNVARSRGGGIYAISLNFIDSVVENNHARQVGGGAYVFYPSQALIIGSTIRNNSANSGFEFDLFSVGGGIAVVGPGELTISNTVIESNVSGGGGGIFASDYATLIVTDSIITNNEALRAVGNLPAGQPVSGGGIFSRGNLVVTRTTIHGNSANFYGGGIAAEGSGSIAISDSLIEGNRAALVGGGLAVIARESGSGGIAPAAVTGSTIRNNGAGGSGGGIWGVNLLVSNSTISGNEAERGGGLDLRNSTVHQSTVSGNTALIGGGIYAGTVYSQPSHVVVRRSTVAANAASSLGSGIFVDGANLSLDHTIVAQNVGNNRDLNGLLGSTIVATYSLIGMSGGTGLAPTGAGAADANGNLIGGTTPGSGIAAVDPVLADNGGPTLTHALLAGSPAIHAGDPSAVAGQGGVPMHDQRGAPFIRVFGGRIDMGAVEAIPAGFLPGDYNRDGVVDAGDYTNWRNQLGQSASLVGVNADGNGDGVVDVLDYAVWKANYGSMLADVLYGEIATGGGGLSEGARGREQGAGDFGIADFELRIVENSRGPTVRGVRTDFNREATALDDALLAWLARRDRSDAAGDERDLLAENEREGTAHPPATLEVAFAALSLNSEP